MGWQDETGYEESTISKQDIMKARFKAEVVDLRGNRFESYLRAGNGYLIAVEDQVMGGIWGDNYFWVEVILFSETNSTRGGTDF